LHRRLLAGFFYLFATIYVVGALGMWVRWLLVKRNPWLWTISFLLKGHHPWSRLVLVGYWVMLVSISISSWQAVVSNAKRFRSLGNAYSRPNSKSSSTGVAITPSADAPGGVKIMDGQKRNVGVNMNLAGFGGSASALAKEHNTVAIRKASHLSLNARRKFFHALALLLFLPGIAMDPAFTHLAFSLAFSLFIFAEYVRYYALYPFGAALHIFMSEFLDHKDSGPVILSHFYLLTGCAGPLWLEGHSRILHQTGVLVLGIGDALASIVGRKYGRHCWPGSSKTAEGTLAFFTSVVLSAWLLRLTGLCEPFDMAKYAFVIAALALLEGVSDQHDNLILPIFAYIVASLVGL
jgi:dolichol kinase